MKKILIVDYARLIRNIIKNCLANDSRLQFLEANTGIDAVECYKENHPDLVTMDITMEQKNGVDAALEILEYDRHARVIMVTSIGQEKCLRECMKAGVKGYLIKPFTKDKLRETVLNALT